MQIETTVSGLRSWRKGKSSVGLVPTMGALHAGHLALVRRAREECDAVAASIFVNPTQFGPHDDFARYPRSEERDLALFEAEGVDCAFVPSVEEMYPPGNGTLVVPGTIALRLEGRARPGHFRGVSTVVTKLLNIAQPDRVYFGEKDAQQLRVVQTLVRDLRLLVSIVPVPTVREQDGLALSSRNAYLSPDERQAAVVLWRALQRAQTLWQSGERGGPRLRVAMRAVIETEPLAALEYASIADPVTLREIRQATESALASLAVRIGGTRLIDNLLLKSEETTDAESSWQ